MPSYVQQPYYSPGVQNQYRQTPYYAPSYSGQVLGATTGGGIAKTPTTPAAVNDPYANINQGQNNANAQIDADYESAMGLANNAEQGLRSQAGVSSGQIDIQAGDTRNQLTNSQTTQEQGVNTSLQTGETQAKSSLQQARDLFRQTQQSNIAQLSALGISSSSVSEALAERLGVETARRIAGVTDSLGQIRVNAQNELNRVKTYYTGQLDTLSKNVENQKAQIQTALVQGLNQINSARQQAAAGKAQARANLLYQVQSQLGQIAQQEQQFRQSMDQWAQQKAAALTPIAQDPNYLQNFASQLSNLQQNPQFAQFNIGGQLNQNSKGDYSGQYTFGAKKQQFDPNDPTTWDFLGQG